MLLKYNHIAALCLIVSTAATLTSGQKSLGEEDEVRRDVRRAAGRPRPPHKPVHKNTAKPPVTIPASPQNKR